MKAKTKTSVIMIILVAMLGVVFAFSFGNTFASGSFNLEVGSDQYSTTTSMAKQNYAVINDTVSMPVVYSDGNHIREISVEYSYSYDFDIRIKYSLNWIGASSSRVDNVILNYASRNSLIVDNNYIYYKDTISAGSGKLNLITGIQFSDSDNENYALASLQVAVEVKITKASTAYTTDNAIYTSTTAGEAWLRYKNNSDYENAYIMIYNRHTNINNGVKHPGINSAYGRTITGGNLISSAKWLGGNRVYGGLSLYIITGNQPYNIVLSASGSWQNSQGESGAHIVTNNIKMNYSDDWTIVDKDGPVFDLCEYRYTIPANSAIYINVLDSIEITSAGNISSSDYTGYVITTSLTINGSSFTSNSFVDGMQTAEIAQPNSMQTSTTTYIQPIIEIINATKFKSALYNTYVGGQQDFDGSVLITNNTSEIRKITINFAIRCYISNGLNVLFNQSGDDYVYGTSFNNGALWYREVTTLTSGYAISVNDNQFSLSGNNATMTYSLAPYSSVNVIEGFSLSIDSAIIASFGNYDVWVELIPTLAASPMTTADAVPEVAITTSYSGGNTHLTMSIKNMGQKRISNLTINPTIYETSANSPERLWVQPNDWVSNYWNYYYLSGSEYIKNTSPLWTTSNEYYSITYSKTPIAVSMSFSNGFLLSGNSYRATSLILQPGESAIVGTAIVVGQKILSLDYTSSAGASQTIADISIINENTSTAFVKNTTQKSYYVRFTGNLAEGNSLFVKVDGYIYYLGVVRPNQVVAVDMLAGTCSFETIEATETYTSSMLSSWGSSAQQIFENYFKNS